MLRTLRLALRWLVTRRLAFRTAFAVMLIALATLPRSSLAAPGLQDAPAGNVLLIIADDLGIDAIDAYGVGTDPADTPTIDALVDDGIVFERAWAYPVCTPFRASALTGRYGFRTGVGTAPAPLPVDEVTIPEALDAQPDLGVAHAAFGKWHLSDRTNGGPRGPNVAGFSHYAGGLGNIDAGPADEGPYDYFRWRKTVDGVTTISTSYATTDTDDEAIDWVGEQDSPWFAYVAFHSPHVPLHTVDLPGDAPGMGDDALPYFRAMIQAMDTEIGRILGSLSPEERAATTLIFVGDNGSPTRAATTPGSRGRVKGSLYQGGIHTPLIISGAGVSSPGRRVRGLASSVDLFGTVLELLGADGDAWTGDAIDEHL